jgi:hypothetical protein
LFGSLIRRPLFWVVVALAVLIMLVATAGCGKPAQDPCQVNPTRTAADGRWVEADGEDLDADPCDSDDLEEDSDSHKKKKPTKRKR